MGNESIDKIVDYITERLNELRSAQQEANKNKDFVEVACCDQRTDELVVLREMIAGNFY